MVEHTRQLVKQNGCEEVVTVLQGRAEELELPEQVDILVSEWMGNCLLVIIKPSVLLVIKFSVVCIKPVTFKFGVYCLGVILEAMCKVELADFQ